MALTEKEQLAAENDQRLKQVEKDIAKLQEAPAQIKELGAQMGKLMQYYYGPWRDDREELDKAGKGQYGVLSEDAIWDQMSDYRGALEDLLHEVETALKDYKT